MSSFSNNQINCISPWYELRINPDGSYTYCHAAKSFEQSALLPSQWFAQGNLTCQTRKKITDGLPVSGCAECYSHEQQGLVSFRHRRNQQAAIYNGAFERESIKTSPAWPRLNNQVANYKPAFLHVCLSNLCNLSCRMCQPKWSSQLTSTLKRAELIDQSVQILQDWTADHAKWQDFLTLVLDNPSLICLHFMGGEPMLHKKFYELIDLCIENNTTDFHLTFVTNGTCIDHSIVEKLLKFKSATIEISVENFHHSNDYIRLNSNWQQVQHNIDLLLKHRSPKFDVVLRPVPQALSIMHYYTLIDYALANQVGIDNNVMARPEYLKIVVLPSAIKKATSADLQHRYQDLLEISKDSTTNEKISLLRNTSQIQQQISVHIQSVLTLLNEPEPENIAQLRTEFLEYNRKIDNTTSQKFDQVYPELTQFFAD
jgi:sulfatase maturation enzyme AslB (radical SAM superfamily)